MQDGDHVQRFVFEGLPLRGQLAHLNASWRAMLSRHAYPAPVQQLLGEATVAALLLSATIKYSGSLILQLHGDGPVSMLVVECTSERTIRGLAHWSGEVTPAALNELMGTGRLVITVEPRDDAPRYQSIVSLDGSSIAEVLEGYLRQSEQIDTRLWIASDRDAAAGMLLQKLPGECPDKDAWERATVLGETVKADELLRLPSVRLLHRLYHDIDIRLFDAEPVSFRCTCSQRRVKDMLRALGAEEIRDILREQGKIGVHCEFCNRYYEFDPVDAEFLLATDHPPELTRTSH